MSRLLRSCTRHRWLALVLVACLGCRIPIRTSNVGPEATYRDLNANALNQGVLSPDTRLVLNRFDLADEFELDPVSAIRKLHALAVEQPGRMNVFALAETSYLAAQRGMGQDGYLAAAVYAYLYFFGTESDTPANPYDRSFRVACDLYNYGLLKAFRTPDGQRFLFSSGSHQLPVGRIEVRAATPGLQWSEQTFEEFVPADNIRVTGFSSRRRDAGLGVPLIAVLRHRPVGEESAAHVPPRSNIAATAFLRMEGGLADLERNASATLEFHSAFDVPFTRLGERTVPLEADLTAPLAYQMSKSEVWSLEIASFLQREKSKYPPGIWTLQPYQKGKIPVVFVHGTASSPLRWAEMFNQLNADPDLRAAYQFWFFTYTTGNPILYSASLLRDSLTDVIHEFDPEGKDSSLRDIVLIGHSQGGILAKMQAMHSGEVFWQNLERASLPLEQLSQDERERLRHFLVFEPHPAVKRVVFISTPQHGSFVAGNWIGRFTAGLVAFPSHFIDTLSGTARSSDFMKQLEAKLPTSVDNMKEDHPFAKALASIDVAEGIHSHSIISVNGEGPPEELDDGVVQYKSAHLEHADSELVVRSGHSCQGNPSTIQEVRRILLLHLKESAPSHP